MEYLDTYDENKNFLGKVQRDIVHKDGLWHNTVHCWLYDSSSNIYFQIRSDEKKFYTTASGHVLAGETIKQAFGREIKEEIGIDIDYEKSDFVSLVIWKMDKQKKDGSIFKDRAFSNIYLYKYDESDWSKFNFDDELDGLVKVKARDALNLFKVESGCIPAEIILKSPDGNKIKNVDVSFSDFLINAHETATGKYGDILNRVIELTK